MLGQPERQGLAAGRGGERLAGVTASGCWECGGTAPPPLVFALGQIGYDFGSEERRDWFLQMGVADPQDPAQLLAHLERHPAHGSALIWTLEQESIPLYAVQPGGAFAAEGYARLRHLLREQITRRIEIVSLPGSMEGGRTLADGRTLPVVWPHLRGVQGVPVSSFLERVFYEIRNPGRSPQERAVNFVATRPSLVESVYEPARRARLELSAIAVERSLLCRPDGDCWDVKLTFFDPRHRMERAKQVFRLTVDVSEALPVSVGGVHGWHAF